MNDFRLRVFYVVAKRLSFTKAAAELFISQPAVSKHIHEIEAHYETQLFDRNGTRIKLTQAGLVLLKQVERLMDIYRTIDTELAALANNTKGTLRIGASTTVAQYYLSPHMASFKTRFPDVQVSLVVNNTEAIENLLAESKIDLGIVEGQPKRPHITYHRMVKDEIVLCTRVGNPLMRKGVIKPDELRKLPMIFREAGSGSLDVISSVLRENGIQLADMQKEIELQGAESIKSYLLHSNAFAFLSIHAIFKELKDNELRIIDIKGLQLERYFYGIVNHGDAHKLPELFFRHLTAIT